ncbi:MAG: PEP-CTERM sorting domain-containing protein [Candidatus Solibacter usitatus]|nr:PEP-CTERM sorting domain-containing protein [Candidatus Solibacter usitatus]
MKKLVQLAVICVTLGVPTWATPLLFSGSSGTLAASATFTASGSTLVVTLSNISSTMSTVPADLLTAIFFDISGGVTLTPVSAYLMGGATVLGCGAGCTLPPGGNVGGEWAYNGAISGGSGVSQHYGISSTGVGIFGSGNFGGPNLQGPASVDGMQYGIGTSNYNPAFANPGMAPNAVIVNAVVFTLTGLPAGFDPWTAISNMRFQYGTSLCEPSFPGTPEPIPEPMTMALTGAGLAGLAFIRRRLA